MEPTMHRAEQPWASVPLKMTNNQVDNTESDRQKRALTSVFNFGSKHGDREMI